MSCTILFKKIAIKLSDGRIFPMILVGDNRTFTASFDGNRAHEKYARSWYPGLWFSNDIAQHDKLLWNPEEYVSAIEKDIEKKLEKNRCQMSDFEYYGTRIGSKTATYKQLRSYFCNMVRDALTIDEFVHLNGPLSVRIRTVDWSNDKTRNIQTKTEYFQCCTEDELIKLDECYQKSGYNCYCEPILPENVRGKERNKTPKSSMEKKYVVKIDLGYVVKTSARNIWYDKNISFSTRRFASENEAKRWIEKSKHPRIQATGIVEKIA